MDQSNLKKEDVNVPSMTLPTPVAATASTTTVEANKRPAPAGNGSLATAAPAAKKPNNASTSNQKSQLQQQIQQQLQQQLQAQLQAAAARGQQANITPEQIQVRQHLCLRDLVFFAMICYTIEHAKQYDAQAKKNCAGKKYRTLGI